MVLRVFRDPTNLLDTSSFDLDLNIWVTSASACIVLRFNLKHIVFSGFENILFPLNYAIKAVFQHRQKNKGYFRIMKIAAIKMMKTSGPLLYRTKLPKILKSSLTPKSF